MPKSQLDWLGVVTLWLGAVIMAVKAGGVPLLYGMPLWLTANWWNYIPLVLVSIYLAIAIYRAVRPQEAATLPEPAAEPPAGLQQEDPTNALRERRADRAAVSALMTAERKSREALASRSVRSMEAEMPNMKAALLSAHKRFGTPLTPEYKDAALSLELGRRLIEKMLPFLEAGHVEEARNEAQDFLDRLQRPQGEAASSDA